MERENERINKLKGEQDWNMWKFLMKILLASGEAWDVVQGHATKPERPRGENQAEVTEYQKKLKAWVKTDSTAQKLLILNVSEQSMLHLVNCENAKEMWDKLVSVYEGKNATSKYMLQTKWFALTKDPQDDILSHIAKIEDISHRLKALGEPVTESMIITKILLTLPSSLNHFACAWKSLNEEQRTLANLTSRLMIEEARTNIQDKTTDSALTVKARRGQRSKVNEQIKPKHRTGEYFKCGKKGHWKRECKSKSQRNGKAEEESEALIGEEEITRKLMKKSGI